MNWTLEVVKLLFLGLIVVCLYGMRTGWPYPPHVHYILLIVFAYLLDKVWDEFQRQITERLSVTAVRTKTQESTGRRHVLGPGFMKPSNPSPPHRGFLAGAVAVVIIGYGLALIAQAFAKGSLTPDERMLLQVVAALVGGMAGFAFAGKMIVNVGKPGRITIAATSGFAVWLLTHYFFSSHPANQIRHVISATKGLPFSEAANAIAHKFQTRIEFVGFTELALKTPILKEQLEGNDCQQMLLDLGEFIGAAEGIRPYRVIFADGLYRLERTTGPPKGN